MAITLGRGVYHPQGRRLDLDATAPVAHLARVLDEHRGSAAWWAGSAFTGDYRDGSLWISSAVLTVDVDYYDADGERAPLPKSVREAIADLVVPKILASIIHRTPRGVRAAAVLDRAVTEPFAYERAAHAFMSRVANALAVAGLIAESGRNGLVIDVRASTDRVHLMFTPKATARGVVRDANVLIVGAVTPLDELLREGRSATNHAPRVGIASQPPVGDELVRLILRGRAYLATIDPAIQGQDGSGTTFRAAHALVRGLGLPTEMALHLLDDEYNQRCQPPWTLKELRHKVESAAKADRVPPLWLASSSEGRGRPGGGGGGGGGGGAKECWPGSMLVRVLQARLKVHAASDGKAALTSVQLACATLDFVPVFPQYVTVPDAGHPSAQTAYDAVMGDIPPEAWFGPNVTGHEGALVGRVLEIDLPPGARLASKMRRFGNG